MVAFLKNLFGGNETRREVSRITPIVKKTNDLELKFTELSDYELKEKTQDFKKRLKGGETLEEILPEAFATVREAAKRTLKQRHFDVQLIGGVVLHEGKISEMKTGEGKTLVATLPAYLNALDGSGVHIVTVNDYLSRRDAVWMGQIYNFLGMSVGVLNHEASFLYNPQPTTDNQQLKKEDEERDKSGSFKVVHEFLRPVSRREAYEADITYGTNSEFGFDYLRDNLEYAENSLRQKDFNYAIVDEIDSILIDEARTPLIISAPTAESESLYKTFAGIADKLKDDEHYKVDEKLKAITVTDEGITEAEKFLGIENIYTEKGIKYVHHLETAVRAKALYHRDVDYVIRDGEVIIVDTFTGRLQPGRRWSEGLHQAIEAKEGVEVQKESRTFASITYQNYFRMYRKLSGMTGTAITSAEEFYRVYGLGTVDVPTNRPMVRKDQNDLIFQTEAGKFKAIISKVKELNSKGQPALIGTASIEKNELLSSYLTRDGIKHELLNAKNHEREAEIIAQAGKIGAVTIATNLAGRGVDIKLGGALADKAEYENVNNLGGLFVLGTERHEARRIDNQLRGRSGRQGDPGETQFFVSLEDTLMRVFASDTIKKMMGRFGIPEDQPIENKMITGSLERAQERIEGFNFDARKHVLEYDDVLNFQRKIVYERRRKILLGGPDVIEEYLNEILSDRSSEKETIDKKKEELGREQFLTVSRIIILQTIDMFWVEHLEMMDYLRGSVNLRAYGQRDPLVEYKREGLKLFKEMETGIEDQIIKLLPHIGVQVASAEMRNLQEVQEGAVSITSSTSSTTKSENIGRNDPCPCGSGKKYKKCGLLNTEEHQKLMAKK
ncbi:MAG TPA: preprotein translocase subunit SecA [Candidatus Paceibacterota bacterium]